MRHRVPAVFLSLSAILVGQGPPTTAPLGGVREALDIVDARWHGATVIADGNRGRAARFDGDDDRIDVGPCPATAAAPFTLRCALRTTIDGFCTPLMARDGESVALSLVLGRQPGRVSFEAWSWGAVRLQSRERIDDGAWHHIEATYDPDSNLALLFVDERLQGFAELGDGGAPTARLRLGDNIGAHQPFAGDLDEVSVLPATSHRELLATLTPVLPRAAREAALAHLRAQLLPTSTPALLESAAANWSQRRLAVRAHVADALGLSPTPPRVDLDVRVHAELVRDGVRLQRISWVGWPGQRATGWLWLPDPLPAGRHPAVLNPHGHWPGGARHPVVQARCAAFAKFGWVALAVDSVHVEHVASGVNAVGAMTWHNQRAIDLLARRDDVDPTHIASTGASGGAQQTYYLMALEDRLVAVAPMVMACYLSEIVTDIGAHCGCNHVPRLAAGTDVPEMCAVFAPRPAMFGSVTGDWTHAFPEQGLPELTALWARLGGPTPRSRHAEEGHNYDRPMREQVYAFLTEVMDDAPAGSRGATIAEPPFRAFDNDELRPLLQACPDCQLDPRTMATEYLARRPAVTTLAALAPGLDLQVTARDVAPWPTAPGWHALTIHGNDGVPIPVRVQGNAAGDDAPVTVVVDPRGMDQVLCEQPAWLAAPSRIALVDPRPYGEWSRFRPSWQRNGLLLGRGEGYQAALDTAIVCASMPGHAPVHLVGIGEAGVVALLAAHLCPRIAHVVTTDLGATYAEDGNRLPLCPELLRCADLPELARTLPVGTTYELGGAKRWADGATAGWLGPFDGAALASRLQTSAR